MKSSFLRYIIIFFVAMTWAVPASALTLDEAKNLYKHGAYAEALPALQSALKAKPADAVLNRMVGNCLYKTGDIVSAKKYLDTAIKKKDSEAYLCMAHIAWDEYAPDEASNYIEQYRASLKKGRKTLPESPEVEPLEKEIEKLRSMLSRVEKIVIIDSVAVDRHAFFEAYKLSPESGAFYSTSVLPADFTGSGTMVYMPESQTSMLWGTKSSDDAPVELVESSLLSDGSWEHPHSLGTAINDGGDADFPFLMTDGITLYLANNGENSLGGYDIFISRRGDDNKFLAPQNLGMPYNSPYDDYLLAIDETTGVGWWATDRNQLGDQITIYKFIPSDLRINYAPDEEGLAGYARVDSYRATWPEGADYTQLLETIDNIMPQFHSGSEPEFIFPFPDGKVYTEWDDFHSGAARMLMEQYVDTQRMAKEDAKTLDSLRRRYADGDKSVAPAILELEKKKNGVRASQRRVINEIIRIEQ